MNEQQPSDTSRIVSPDPPKVIRPTRQEVLRWFPTADIETADAIVQKPKIWPQWIIKDLLSAKTATLVSGHPHSMKSLTWLCAAIESVSTHKVFGHFPCPNVKRCLYIEAEDNEILVYSRIQQLVHGLGLRPEDVSGLTVAVTGPFNLLGKDPDNEQSDARALTDLIDHVNPDWVVLSTLQGLIPGLDWNEKKDMGPINSLIVQIARSVPLVVLTHSPHDPKAKRAAGTITQAATYAITLHIEKKDQTIKVYPDSKFNSDERIIKMQLITEMVPGENGEPISEVRRIEFLGMEDEKISQKPEEEGVIETLLKENPNMSSKEIAERLDCSVRKVNRIRKNLGLSNPVGNPQLTKSLVPKFKVDGVSSQRRTQKGTEVCH